MLKWGKTVYLYMLVYINLIWQSLVKIAITYCGSLSVNIESVQARHSTILQAYFERHVLRCT